MSCKRDTLARVHEQMALVKAQSTGVFFTNYFRQEMVGPQIVTAATAGSVLLANDEHEFLPTLFFYMSFTVWLIGFFFTLGLACLFQKILGRSYWRSWRSLSSGRWFSVTCFDEC
jgi:hypothetical protein